MRLVFSAIFFREIGLCLRSFFFVKLVVSAIFFFFFCEIGFVYEVFFGEIGFVCFFREIIFFLLLFFS